MPQGRSLKKELDWIASLRINSSCFEAFALWFCKFAGGSGHRLPSHHVWAASACQFQRSHYWLVCISFFVSLVPSLTNWWMDGFEGFSMVSLLMTVIDCIPLWFLVIKGWLSSSSQYSWRSPFLLQVSEFSGGTWSCVSTSDFFCMISCLCILSIFRPITDEVRRLPMRWFAGCFAGIQQVLV